MAPTLSVLCPTRERGPLVAACLAPLREVADEIIIAADDRACAGDLAHYATVATTLLRFEFCGSNVHWPWLAAQARGDWLMLIDGDEMPSAALIEAIPRAITRRDVRELSIPVHWLFGDAHTRVASEPIGSDRRSHLVRNDPWLAFGARQHEIEISSGPLAYLDTPLYHLGLLLMGRGERERKAAAYDRGRPGLLAADGTPLNTGLYLPEDGPIRTERIPEGDAGRIELALAAGGEAPAAVDVDSLPHAGREEIERSAGIGDPAPMVIDAEPPSMRLVAGGPAPRWWVQVTNGSSLLWPYGPNRRPQVRVGVRWYDRRRVQIGEGRAELGHALAPGEAARIPVTLVPPCAGELVVALDGVDEGVRWFGDPVTFDVQVGPSAAELLAQLEVDSGGRVTLEQVLRVRRESGAIDGVAGDPVGESDRDRAYELCAALGPRAVVQIGAGPLTARLAALLATTGTEAERTKLLVIDHDGAALAEARESLGDLAAGVVLAHRPLSTPAGAPPFYEVDAGLRASISALDPDLLVAGSPRRHDRASPAGALELLRGACVHDVRVLLLDALTDANLGVAGLWSGEDDVTVHGFHPGARIFEATLRRER